MLSIDYYHIITNLISKFSLKLFNVHGGLANYFTISAQLNNKEAQTQELNHKKDKCNLL